MVRKGLTALILVLCISLTGVFPAYAAFRDVPTTAHYYTAVSDLTSKNIISGFPDGSYRPDQPLTRAQMAKLISLAKELPLTSAAANSMLFSDVPSDHWAAAYIRASAASGIVKGYPEGIFKPGNQITRGELAIMLRRAIEMPVLKPAKSTFSDVSTGYWAFGDIETVAHYGIMTGDANGKFRPAEQATRAEIAVSLYRMMNADLTPPVEEDNRKIIVAVDPGHGGSDPGAIAKSNGLKEKDITLDVGLKLQKLLQAAGFEVVMTRSTDVYVGLGERARIANNAMADIFVSVHYNSAESTAAGGAEVWFFSSSQDGERLASLIQEELVKSFANTGVTGRNRGIKTTSKFIVLKETLMPAVLTEGAFLSNPDEAALLATDEFRQKQAVAIYSGIAKYFNQTQ